MSSRRHCSANDRPAAMIDKPPRAPCWRDFLPDGRLKHENKPKTKHKSERSSKHVDFTDVKHVPRSNSDAGELVRESRSVHKGHRRSRNRLHRTRSELSLEHELPNQENMTMSLAETKPKEFNLSVGEKPPFNAYMYLADNKKRCEKWLAGVKASEPLDDVVFSQGGGVEVVMPEETWGHGQCLQPPPNSSASSPDMDQLNLGQVNGRSARAPSTLINTLLGEPLSTKLHSEPSSVAISMIGGPPSVSNVSLGLPSSTDGAIREDNMSMVARFLEKQRDFDSVIDGAPIIVKDGEIATVAEVHTSLLDSHQMPGYVADDNCLDA